MNLGVTNPFRGCLEAPIDTVVIEGVGRRGIRKAGAFVAPIGESFYPTLLFKHGGPGRFPPNRIVHSP